ncbi:MAG TPA: DoxX family membrane protein [Puia sp.]|nr:DoxX family membrane protein [Puia sp.]
MKKISLYLMVVFYVVAGINHFVNTPNYMEIMPPYLPFPLALVYICGVCEIVIGLLLIPVLTRKLAAWLLIALLVAVFPANIQMALNYWRPHNPHLWIAIVRLPIQVLLIAWAYMYTRPNYTVVPI